MLVNSFFRLCICFAAATVFLTACKGSLNVAQLPVPSGTLDESLPDSRKTDYMNIVEDYSKINIGDNIPNGATVTTATDAAQLYSLLTAPNQKVFIRSPADPDDREHIYKAVRAASLRLNTIPNVDHRVRYLNLEKLKAVSNTFRFNAQQEKEYYVSMAKKINDTLKPAQTVLVKVDDIPTNTTPEEFLAQLSTPNLLVLSKDNFDALQLFGKGVKSNQFFPNGLKISHIYSLMLDRFAQSSNEAIKNDAEQLALKNAKILGALKPRVGLGFLATFFKKIEDYLDKTKSSTNVEKDLEADLSSLLETSPTFVDSLEIHNYTIEQIQKKVDDNPQAFREISPSFALAQRSLDEIRNLDLPAIKSQTDTLQLLRDEMTQLKTATNVIQSIKDDTNDTRTVLLPQLVNNIASVTAGIGAARDAINQHTTTALGTIGTGTIRADVLAALTAARDAINQHTTTALGTIGAGTIRADVLAALTAARDAINQHTTTALGTIGAGTIRADVLAALTAARDAINQHTTTALGTIGAGTIRADLQAAITAAQDAINNNTNTKIQGIDTKVDAIKTKTNLIPDNFFNGNQNGILKDTASKLSQLALHSQNLTFFLRNITSELEQIVRHEEGLGNSELSTTLKERIRNATEEAIKTFLLHGSGEEVAQAASQGYAKSISLASAATPKTVQAIKNSALLKDIIKSVSDLAAIENAPRPMAPLFPSLDGSLIENKDERPLVERPVYVIEHPTTFPAPTPPRHNDRTLQENSLPALIGELERSVDTLQDILSHRDENMDCLGNHRLKTELNVMDYLLGKYEEPESALELQALRNDWEKVIKQDLKQEIRFHNECENSLDRGFSSPVQEDLDYMRRTLQGMAR